MAAQPDATPKAPQQGTAEGITPQGTEAQAGEGRGSADAQLEELRGALAAKEAQVQKLIEEKREVERREEERRKAANESARQQALATGDVETLRRQFEEERAAWEARDTARLTEHRQEVARNRIMTAAAQAGARYPADVMLVFESLVTYEGDGTEPGLDAAKLEALGVDPAAQGKPLSMRQAIERFLEKRPGLRLSEQKGGGGAPSRPAGGGAGDYAAFLGKGFDALPKSEQDRLWKDPNFRKAATEAIRKLSSSTS